MCHKKGVFCKLNVRSDFFDGTKPFVVRILTVLIRTMRHTTKGVFIRSKTKCY